MLWQRYCQMDYRTPCKMCRKWVIPGVSTVAGGMISGTTAGLLTTALGGAYIKIMEMVYKGEINKENLCGADGQKEMTRLFKEALKKKK